MNDLVWPNTVRPQLGKYPKRLFREAEQCIFNGEGKGNPPPGA